MFHYLWLFSITKLLFLINCYNFGIFQIILAHKAASTVFVFSTMCLMSVILLIANKANADIYIKNVKSPNLELQPQGISYRERERDIERDPVQCCQIKQDFRVAKKAETPNLLNL